MQIRTEWIDGKSGEGSLLEREIEPKVSIAQGNNIVDSMLPKASDGAKASTVMIGYRVKRFASLDFMRGLAIVMMICLHVVDTVLNQKALIADINNQSLIGIGSAFVLPFLGGLAGFFLITSAISNMVSMHKQQEKGLSARGLILRQVVGGVLIVFFAMLTEALIGYNGSFGQFVRDIGGTYRWDFYAQTALSRWNQFETIQTIGWCVILTGIIQGLLSKNGGWKNTKRLIKWYTVIAVAVIALTAFVWIAVGQLIPGYPWAKTLTSGLRLYTPLIGVDNFGYVLISPFLAALAAPMEPLFPYLAVSCVGSIIGLVMVQKPELIPKNFVKKVLLGGLAAFIVGGIGVLVTFVQVMSKGGFSMAINMWVDLPSHRNWFPDDIARAYAPFLNVTSWLWQFLALNGFAIMLTMMIIYLVDWRGIGHQFANNRIVRFVRRFGFTAFSNYNNQWLYFIVWIGVSLVIMGQPRADMLWDGTLLVLFGTLLVYTLILLTWEKVGFIGSIEWAIGTIASTIVPSRRDPSKAGKKWYQRGKLDVQAAFYNVESISVITPDANYHTNKEDSKMLAKISKIALFSLIFMPFNIVTLFMSRGIKKTEGPNPALKQAVIVSVIGTAITVAFIVVLSVLTPHMLGFKL
jgi:hypothetical protein